MPGIGTVLETQYFIVFEYFEKIGKKWMLEDQSVCNIVFEIF